MVPFQQLVRVSPYILDPSGPLGDRIPPRPAELRQDDYLANFDALSLWYDAFVDSTGEMAVLTGPPLLNLEQRLAETKAGFFAGSSALPCMKVPMDRCLEFWVDVMGADHRPLRLCGDGYSLPITPMPNHCDWFAGRRVLFTKSRDNRLEWIQDWVQFHVQAQGAEAVLFYDNGSTSYTSRDVLQTLASVPGLAVAVVVEWPFPFGPKGGNGMPWDSDFCEHGILAHGRRRFLEHARSVLSCDVDELVLPTGAGTVFDLAERAHGGYISFRGRWVHVDCHVTPPIRHRDHKWFNPSEGLCPGKWAVVPARQPDVQWGVHSLPGCRTGETHGLTYRHFRRISNSWKWNRDQSLNPANGTDCQVDVELQTVFDKISGTCPPEITSSSR